MRNTTLVSLAVAVLAFAGCGSTKQAATTATTSSAPSPTQTSVFDVTLTGFARELGHGAGSPNGSAFAVISINPSKGELCWHFSQLKNVTAPTVARLFQNFTGASGAHGFLLGNAYKPSGCIPLEQSTLELMVTKPQLFYVNIHDAQFPKFGAVR